MTCEEFRSYFEIITQTDMPPGSDEFSEHIHACPDCRSFVQVQQALGDHLRFVRDSVPQVPAWLDAAVLANYREYVAGRMTPRETVARRRTMPLGLAWKGALAAGALAAVILIFAGRNSVHTTTPPRAVQPAAVLQLPQPNPVSTAGSEKIKPRVLHAATHERRRQSAFSATRSASLPDGFRSLMYCDPLSCAEAMEIIRVQLPTPFAGLTPASTSASGVVFADVLVGPDGIARGIRIVE